MADVILFLTGAQIGVYDDLSVSGNSNGVKVTLNGVEALGSEDQIFKVVVSQVSNGDTAFENGQFVAIYAWPESEDGGDAPLYAWLNPQDDQFQGRASSSEHQIFTEPANIVFDVNGVGEGNVRYGPGKYPLRADKLPFDAFGGEVPEQMCFTPGTRIETERGARPIERLRVGDRVWTLDNGLQELRWIGRRRVLAHGRLAPVAFEAGAVGNDRRLVVSPQHRMLVTGWRAQMLFGTEEVLVPARALVDGRAVRRLAVGAVDYLHLAFDRHEVLRAEGAAAESLHLAAVERGLLTPAQRAEIAAVFPELGQRVPPAARTCPRMRDAGILAA